MDFRKELQWIMEARSRKVLSWDEQYTDEEIQQKLAEYQNEYEEGHIDFSGFIPFRLRQGKKKRDVKMYDQLSAEEILSIYLHNKLKQRFRVEFPNRNTYIRSLFNVIYALKDMSDYTIFKFDFEDFFNSVSSVYVYRKYIQGKGLERYQENLLGKFVEETQFAYAGLRTSNVICEIIARNFDEEIRQAFMSKGLIYYRRYIDDGILIFNRYVSRDECGAFVQQAVEKIFHDHVDDEPVCKTTLSTGKTKYIARRYLKSGDPASVFDFLGYEFSLSIKDKKTDIKYGITGEKIEKYRKKIRQFMRQYAQDPKRNMELLRHQIKGFSHRTVYQEVRNNKTVWINKGFLANYHELGNHLDQLSEDTNRFLRNALTEEAQNVLGKIPYFLKDSDKPESSCNLFNNLQRNRTQVFAERIGIGYGTLQSMSREIGINPEDCKKYDSLLKAYLRKIGVGY